MEISKVRYGCCKAGEVQAFTIVNGQGASVTVMTYGCRILSLKMPDRHGRLDDVILGYDSLEGYLQDTTSQGAIVGRYGNRIAGGRFALDGQVFQLAQNQGRNHLHGGWIRYADRIWAVDAAEPGRVTMCLDSPDGEQGYPGRLQVQVTYTLNDNNELGIRYQAVTNRPTVLNLSNHSYFNLSSCRTGDVSGHLLQVESDAITEVDEELIPTGRLMQTQNTALDFTNAKQIGRDIDSSHPQMRLAGGYDHNFVLRGQGLRRVATLCAPDTGRCMDVLTDQCGMQVYSANNLNHPAPRLRGGRPQQRRIALCLETQHFPDSPNHPQFPSTVLRPGEKYDTTTIYRFYLSGEGAKPVR